VQVSKQKLLVLDDTLILLDCAWHAGFKHVCMQTFGSPNFHLVGLDRGRHLWLRWGVAKVTRPRQSTGFLSHSARTLVEAKKQGCPKCVKVKRLPCES
jgi:hypothetical protein